MNYLNPVTELTIDNWPYGRKRVKCIFSVETKGDKQRAVRITDNPKGGTNKPKKMTYADKVVFVTGDDDRTYVLNLSMGSINVMQSNMKLQQEYIYSDDPRFNTLIAYFN